MSHIAYVNGTYVPHNTAQIHIEDRGFQFADSVYEVVYLYKNKQIDKKGHLDRLERSLNELSMGWPVNRRALELIIDEMIRKNRLQNGLIYIQVSRGSAPRDFPIPKNVTPTLVITTRRLKPFSIQSPLKETKVLSMDDMRWARRDIKTTQLLAASLCKQEAIDQGFDDAWLIDENGYITEGTSNNAWIVTKDGVLKTRKPDHDILNGITRQSIMALAEKRGLQIVEEAFTLDDVYNAKEAFISSASACIKPVTQINDRQIGNGNVGIITQQIAEIYAEFLENHP